MSFFMLKSILGSIFLLAGIAAVLSMFILMGKQGLKLSASFLRRFHKMTGFLFFIFLLLISYLCVKYWISAGDNISTRAVFHGVLALILFIVLVMKLLIVQFYKQLLRFAPFLGMTVFCLAFVVFFTSAGYYFLRTACVSPEPVEESSTSVSLGHGSIERGASIFANKCSSCHFADREERKAGPGLKGLLKKEILPSSRRPATIENVKRQIIRPFLAMPAFASLPEQEMADLLAYLQSL